MLVFMFVLYTPAYVCTYNFVYVYTYTCILVCMFTHIQTHPHRYMYTVFVHMPRYTCEHTKLCLYIIYMCITNQNDNFYPIFLNKTKQMWSYTNCFFVLSKSWSNILLQGNVKITIIFIVYYLFFSLLALFALALEHSNNAM